LHSLPPALLSSLAGIPGFDAASFQRVHDNGEQVTSVRFNPAKWAGGWPAAGFGDLAMVKIPWSSDGYYLSGRPSFVFDPLFHAGTYYVQEASSMFVGEAIRQTSDISQPLRVLDLCAALGGKSTLLQSLLSFGSLLVSNEVIRNRVNILQENMVKWGGANVVITSNDPRDFQRLENYFDVIVVDAPCSGSGLFRREREAIGEWSTGNVELCRQRQQRILADVWPALRRGGVLVYSTCSYSREEDEDILDWMMDNLDVGSLRLSTAADWNIVETTGKKGAYGYRFYPDRLKGEGLFIGCVQKNEGGSWAWPRKKSAAERLTRKEEEGIRSWVQPDQPLLFFRHQEYSYALPEHRAEDLGVLQSSCYLKKAGVLIGKPAGKDFIPEHDLALSTLINRQLPAVQLSRQQAVQYLRKEEIQIETAQRGWTLVQYEGQNLGWVKILPNRTNNYYPKEWRILKRDD
jgi:16S rRNA C967 or C1407 C5-methylase (RsmB/RsmF family)/NOL1/NOP2/fmu family ribosome biogenesis protein